MFRVKICGITSVQDAQMAVQAGADAIGLNFYASSPRVCSQPREISQALGSSVCKVGVFVNASAEEIRSAVADYGLDLVQLHGDEPPEFLRTLRGVPIMRALRAAPDHEGIQGYLDACYVGRCLPRMLLLDALQVGHYGGTGITIDWQALHQVRRTLRGVPLILAGGLTAENVAEAIATARPWGVDTASGVEESPGKKSPAKVAAFVSAAKTALAASAVAR